MKLISKVIGDTGVVLFQGEIEIDAEMLILISASKVPVAVEKGEEFVKDGTPVFGKELVEAVQRRDEPEIERAAMTTAMLVYFMESVFLGVADHVFADSDLEFVMLPGGAVRYTRLPH